MPVANPTDIGTIDTAATATTQTLTTTGTVPAGAKIWVGVSWFLAAGTLSSVQDGSALLTWTIDKQDRQGSTGFAVVSADAPAGFASGSTIQANYSGSSTDRAIWAMYSTGVLGGAGAAYGAVSQDQNTNTAWSSTATTVTSGDILIGGCHWENGVVTSNTASGGNTKLHDFGHSGSETTSEYQIGTGASIAIQGTWANASGGAPSGTCSVAVAYKQAASGAPVHAPIPFYPPGRF